MRAFPIGAAALVALWLVLALGGWHRLCALLPLASGAVGQLAMRRRQPAPPRVRFSLVTGWSLPSGCEEVPVRLEPGSHIGRHCLLLAFRADSGRRWIVLHLRGRRPMDPAWRRLCVLRRTAPDTLVRKWTNC